MSVSVNNLYKNMTPNKGGNMFITMHGAMFEILFANLTVKDFG